MSEIARRYARALYLYAKNVGQEAECFQYLTRFQRMTENNPVILRFLSAPIISGKIRMAVAQDSMQSGYPEYILSFIRLLIEKNRISGISEIVNEYEEIRNEEEGILRAEVTVAYPPDRQQEEKIQTFIQGAFQTKKAMIQYHVNPKIGGGFIVESRHIRLDCSLYTRLRQLNRVLKNEVNQ